MEIGLTSSSDGEEIEGYEFLAHGDGGSLDLEGKRSSKIGHFEFVFRQS